MCFKEEEDEFQTRELKLCQNESENYMKDSSLCPRAGISLLPSDCCATCSSERRRQWTHTCYYTVVLHRGTQQRLSERPPVLMIHETSAVPPQLRLQSCAAPRPARWGRCTRSRVCWRRLRRVQVVLLESEETRRLTWLQ